MLPAESHGYRARESILHMLWEEDRWLDQFVKRAKPARRGLPRGKRQRAIAAGMDAEPANCNRLGAVRKCLKPGRPRLRDFPQDKTQPLPKPAELAGCLSRHSLAR
ncbi:Uncharacterised protein [Chromobacterium violaceum]|uniref:Uncharacterized protein n=1 Tax=Chromobacterium violaceum TaxID=536 RepID=A0A3S4I7G8_CHRVL|nr:Uncharacterised protein [Chromobacterium violaceum]